MTESSPASSRESNSPQALPVTDDWEQAPDLAQLSSFERVNRLCARFLQLWDQGHPPDLATFLQQVPPDEQPNLLRNLLECEIKQRWRNGEAPHTQEYITRVPEELHHSVRQLFLEVSTESAGEGQNLGPSEPPTVPQTPAASRLGEYRLVRELGRGGMGTVFEAIHLGRGHRVALKTLPSVSGDSLHRFKREFRALAEVTHPNLVGLRTLENDGGQWFITLDLLEGCHFLAYVRPDNTLDEIRLRRGLAQLAAGVLALHARGVVHRDLKPGNVMVTHGERVVILDFGLVTELNRAAQLSANNWVVGTPAYMAPEQAAGGVVGPPADWYAVGVMLYEALAGIKPFVGDSTQVLYHKQMQDAPALPAHLNLPADLSNLCMALLARDPARRPDPLAIAGVIASAVPDSHSTVGTSEQLIARESQMTALIDVLHRVQQTRSLHVAFIRGRSGEGKTSLAEAFLAPLRRDPAQVVMSGRCYDRESVPFKALDTLIDALTTYLRSLPEADAALLLPDDMALLAEIFPVLKRCKVVARAPRGRLDALDQKQVRHRAFAALRLLLDRIGERTSLIWFLDDLQWGDADSADAIFEVLRPPEAPPVLFLGSYRSDERDNSPFLRAWESRQKQSGVDLGDQVISVGPLEMEEAIHLVVRVLGRDDEIVRRRALQFQAQTGGNPFLLVELAGCFDAEADTFHTTDIHDVLTRKLEQLPAEAGPLLKVVAISGQAMPLVEAVAVAGLSESPERALVQMRNVRVLRVVGEKVDTYHDRIRYAVLDRMEESERRQLHRRLAEVIEQQAGGLTEVEVNQLVAGTDEPVRRDPLLRVYDLAYHYDAAGDGRKALAYALVASSQARDQYALDVAAQQYAIAQRHAAGALAQVQFRIARGRGEALIQLGRYEEARRELASASALAQRPYDLAAVRLLQGDLCFRLGLVGESIARITEGLQQLGVRVPATRLGVIWGIVKESVIQLTHYVLPWRLHRCPLDANADLANHLLARVEYAYYCHNTLYLLWGSLVGLNRAERLPRSRALAFNYMCHGNNMAVLGWHGRAVRHYEAAIQLSKELNDAWGAAQAVNHFSMGCLGTARYQDAIDKAQPGITTFAKLGDPLEYHLSHINACMGHLGLGDLARATELARAVFESSVRLGDNSCGAMALCLFSRCTVGRLPFAELVGCIQVLPGNHLAAANALMAEGWWHTQHGRTQEALRVHEQAWEICRSNVYLVSYNSWVLVDLVAALRRHVETLPPEHPSRKPLLSRWLRLARWAVRLAWLIRPERPASLRELSLAHASRGHLRKAWKLARKSCRLAEKLQARYQHAQSLLVLGRLAKQRQRPEGEQQIQTALAEIARIESGIPYPPARETEKGVRQA